MAKRLFYFLTLTGIITLSACKKIDQSPEYPFTITVKMLEDSTVVQNIFLEIYVPQTISDLKFTGYSDENGEARFTYDKDAVFQVRATRGKNPYTYIGCTYVRLEPNKRVHQTVYIQPYDPEYDGCFL